MDPENHWLVEEHSFSWGHCQGLCEFSGVYQCPVWTRRPFLGRIVGSVESSGLIPAFHLGLLVAWVVFHAWQWIEDSQGKHESTRCRDHQCLLYTVLDQ